MNKTFRVLGLMSGTSLDGVDIACCLFRRAGSKWTYRLESAATIPYPDKWTQQLSVAHQLGAEDFLRLHVAYGRYLGVLINSFVRRHRLEKIDAVASHGHTIFHQPSGQVPFTFQLGDGAALHATADLPVICDFRSLDVQLGGQGAPLVPIGDRLLFSEYSCCVNLGGIANISMERGKKRLAWDICFVNMVLNHLANEAGNKFDRNGQMARRGKLIPKLIGALENLHGTSTGRPSLGREDFERDIIPLLSAGSLEDRARTFTEYAASQVAGAIGVARGGKVLLTGGGARNTFLQERIRNKVLSGFPRKRFSIDAADERLIDFKEALIFAFLGVLRVCGAPNALASVTGARRDSVCGQVFGFNV